MTFAVFLLYNERIATNAPEDMKYHRAAGSSMIFHVLRYVSANEQGESEAYDLSVRREKGKESANEQGKSEAFDLSDRRKKKKGLHNLFYKLFKGEGV